MKKRLLFLLIWVAALLGDGCKSEAPDLLRDGYYTAEAAEFDFQGWKEYLTIYVSAGRIVGAEYNSRNSSGFIRSWDMDDARRSNQTTGTNLSKYARSYTVALLNRQDPAKITPIAGAAKVHANFQRLAEAAVAQARAGDQNLAFVHLKDQRCNE